jgi:hypothetical protein
LTIHHPFSLNFCAKPQTRETDYKEVRFSMNPFVAARFQPENCHFSAEIDALDVKIIKYCVEITDLARKSSIWRENHHYVVKIIADTVEIRDLVRKSRI